MPELIVQRTVDSASDFNPATDAGYAKANAYMSATISTTTTSTVYSYYFPFEPVQIEFTNLANEYVTIERPGLHPLLAFKAPRLTQVTFKFLVVNRSSLMTPDSSIEDDLAYLNRFASLDAPIRFSGATLLSTIVRHFGDASSSPRSWRITEFSSSVRRKTSGGQANQAECSITLIEDRNPNTNIVTLPPIVYTTIPPTKTTSKTPAPVPPTQPNPSHGWNGMPYP